MQHAMKKLRISATVTAILAFLSLIALVLMFLAFSDIGHEADTTLEWKVVQFCWIELVLFAISSLVTIGLLIKVPVFWKTENTGAV